MAGPYFFFSFLFILSLFSFSHALSDIEAFAIGRRQLVTFQFHKDFPFGFSFDFGHGDTGLNNFGNERLQRAYVALQALKKAIYSDPNDTTSNWVGEDVCSYNGVFCAPALDDPSLNVVAGIDLNNADIAGKCICF